MTLGMESAAARNTIDTMTKLNTVVPTPFIIVPFASGDHRTTATSRGILYSYHRVRIKRTAQQNNCNFSETTKYFATKFTRSVYTMHQRFRFNGILLLNNTRTKSVICKRYLRRLKALTSSYSSYFFFFFFQVLISLFPWT